MAENVTSVLVKPQAENISLDDILYLIQGLGSSRDRKMTIGQLVDFLKNNKLDGMTIGGSGEIRTSSGHPVIDNFYAIVAGIIEATTGFKVGNSEWTPGTNKPSITGLFALEAGQVDASSVVTTDSIDSHTANTNIEVKQRLIRDANDVTAALKLGKTEVGSDLKVTNDTEVVGTLKAGKIDVSQQVIEISDIASVAAAETAMLSMSDGQFFIIVNTSGSALEVHFNGGAAFNVSAYCGVAGVKVGTSCYPLKG